jgi:NAD(P)H-dependent FMN reductase
MKILAFAASLRKDSYNRKLIAQAVEHLKAMPGVDVDHADYREFEMPIYDGDLEDSSGIPAGGLELIKRVQAADAIVISTPEYNGSIPGTLKNAIDWASRTDPFVYPEMFGLPRAHQAFDPSGNFVDAKNKARLQELLESFLKRS